MGTLSSEVVDLFLTRINDYRLDTIYTVSGSFVLNTYVESWLLDSIAEFEDMCDQALTYTVSGSAIEGEFTETLTMINKLILSRIMVKYWLQKSINDILQMNLHVTDRDFKTFSAAQNLKAKQDYLNSLKEELSQDLMNYSYHRNDWANWKNQIFDLGFFDQSHFIKEFKEFCGETPKKYFQLQKSVIEQQLMHEFSRLNNEWLCLSSAKE